MTTKTTTSKALPTFEVDKQGLAKLLARRGKEFIIAELMQNAFDEDTTRVDVTLESLGNGGPGGSLYRLVVEDDNPEGFKNLAHAYTLFAESAKKGDPTKRGRFNLGEKLVIAVCEKVTITTTKGTVLFTADGRRMGRKTRAAGTVFEGELRMTKDEAAAMEQLVHRLVIPEGIEATFNHVALKRRTPVKTFTESLRTEVADAEGNLKATTRKTAVEVHEPLPGETATIYELGIPVVETGDRFHVNVMQKVPLNTDRDNVTPAYLRDLRTAVLNNTYDILKPEDAKSAWVTNAMEDEKADPEAVKAAFKGRFGDKAVIFDPNDPEANKLAASEGYTVVPGGALPKAAWANVKSGGVAAPAGHVTPSPKPYAEVGEQGLKLMDPAHYPDYVRNVVDFAKEYAEALFGATISVRIATDVTWPYAATYGPGQLTLNLGRLGHKWFEQIDESVIDLLIHEFGHHYCGDHLDRKYLNALTRLGALTWRLALDRPELFASYGVKVGVTA